MDEGLRQRRLERVVAARAHDDAPLPGRGRTAAAGAIVAAVCAAAVAGTFRAAVPDDAFLIPGQRAKFADVSARAGEFDAVFFGSSTIHRGISPDLVDLRLAERGHPLRTYNCAFAAGFSFETDAVVRRVVEDLAAKSAGPRKLRFAVIEFPGWEPDSKNLNTLRTVAWHDARQTENALRATALNGRPKDVVLDGAEHVKLFLARTLGAGAGPVFAREIAGDSRDDVAALLRQVTAERGFNPLGKDAARDAQGEPEDDVPAERRAAEFAAGAKDYDRNVAELAAGRGRGRGTKNYPLAALRAQMAFLESHGVRPVYVVAPVPWEVAHSRRLAEKGVVPALLRFNDPVRFPSLFARENRFDRAHVNERGAAEFSRAFADAFADFLDAEGRR